MSWQKGFKRPKNKGKAGTQRGCGSCVFPRGKVPKPHDRQLQPSRPGSVHEGADGAPPTSCAEPSGALPAKLGHVRLPDKSGLETNPGEQGKWPMVNTESGGNKKTYLP